MDLGVADLPLSADLLFPTETAVPSDQALPADGPVPVVDAGQPYQHENITPQTLNGWINAGKVMTLVDVREPAEYAGGHIKGAINLPWNSGVLKQSLAQLSKAKPVVVYCASGNRSNAAATWLVGQAYKPVYDAGGISAWIAAGYPVE